MNLKKDMDAQRRGKPPPPPMNKRRGGSELPGSSARASEDRSSAVPQGPRGTKRGRDIEGIDKVRVIFVSRCFYARFSLHRGEGARALPSRTGFMCTSNAEWHLHSG